jgi:hypothetical protein
VAGEVDAEFSWLGVLQHVWKVEILGEVVMRGAMSASIVSEEERLIS